MCVACGVNVCEGNENVGQGAASLGSGGDGARGGLGRGTFLNETGEREGHEGGRMGWVEPYVRFRPRPPPECCPPHLSTPPCLASCPFTPFTPSTAGALPAPALGVRCIPPPSKAARRGGACPPPPPPPPLLVPREGVLAGVRPSPLPFGGVYTESPRDALFTSKPRASPTRGGWYTESPRLRFGPFALTRFCASRPRATLPSCVPRGCTTEGRRPWVRE